MEHFPNNDLLKKIYIVMKAIKDRLKVYLIYFIDYIIVHCINPYATFGVRVIFCIVVGIQNMAGQINLFYTSQKLNKLSKRRTIKKCFLHFK